MHIAYSKKSLPSTFFLDFIAINLSLFHTYLKTLRILNTARQLGVQCDATVQSEN